MKKALVVIMAVVMILAFAIPALAADGNNGNGNNKIINEYVAGAELKQDFNNAQFHCNAINGNGRVWPVIPADMKKFDGKLTFTKADGTRWDLSAVEDKKGEKLEMVVCPECGSTMWITFSNNSGVPDGKNIQMQHPGENITIIKEWIKHNAPYPDGFKFSANFEIKLSSGKTFKLGPGKYFLPEDLTATVEEISCSKGFELVELKLNGVDQVLAAIEGVKGGDIVKAINEDEESETPGGDGSLRLTKTVEGIAIDEWNLNGIVLADVIDDISFVLYKATVDGDGKPSGYEGDVIAAADLTFEGEIMFSGLSNTLNGLYAVVEIFTPGSLAQRIFENVEPLYVFFVDGIGVAGAKTNFDYAAFYTIVNGYGSGYVLGYPGLNNTGDIFPIAVKVGNDAYPSFCANAGSRAFAGESGMGCAGYYTTMTDLPNGVSYQDFLKAYNYIEAKHGNLNDNRGITQIVTWYLLGAIKDLDLINWVAVEAGTWAVTGIEDAREKVEDVIANYKGFAFNGDEEIIDVVFLTCEHHHDYYDCQPQLVPVRGGSSFNNRINPEYDGPNMPVTVLFNKVMYEGVLPYGVDSVNDSFDFNLYKHNAETDKYDIHRGIFTTDSTGMVTAEDLTPGKYVFREEWALFWAEPFHGEDGDYNLVWQPQYPDGADGMYFVITADGEVVWQDYNVEIPTLNNVVNCKHNVFWNNLDFYYGTMPHTAIEYKGGWIIDFHDLCKGHLVATYQAATCGVPGYIWLKCTDCYISSSIQVEVAIEHNFIPSGEYTYDADWNITGEWYTCTHCGTNKWIAVE